MVDVTCNARCRASGVLELLKALLNQVAVAGSRLRMFVREPQERKSDNRHNYVNWEHQSYVSRREIMRYDHLIKVTGSRGQ